MCWTGGPDFILLKLLLCTKEGYSCREYSVRLDTLSLFWRFALGKLHLQGASTKRAASCSLYGRLQVMRHGEQWKLLESKPGWLYY